MRDKDQKSVPANDFGLEAETPILSKLAKASDTDGQDIRFEGVRTNNLKSINASFPLGKISVVTGVSGSGKSSLVFDTLYGEAYRRYVESLSSFARQYLKALPKPDLDAVFNLPPAIAVKQSRSGASNRSTVGTLTELNDILRVLFTHLATVVCNNCGALVRRDTPDSVAATTALKRQGQRVLIAAPLSVWDQGEKLAAKELKAQLEAQGFTRLLVGDEVKRLEDTPVASLKQAAVVIDRIVVDPERALRLGEAAGLALKVGRGYAWVVVEAPTKGQPGERDIYSTNLECASCRIEYSEPSMALLSFNHPLGACQTCQGFGYASEVDFAKVIPDQESSLAEEGVHAWNFGQFAEYYKWAKASAKKLSLEVWNKPFSKYSAAQWQWLRAGTGRDFDGIDGFFEYLDSKKYKAHYRIHASRFRKYVLCGTCKGARLNPQAMACRLGGLNLAEISFRSIEAVSGWLQGVKGDFSRDQSKDMLSKGEGTISTADRERDEGHGLMGVAEAWEEADARLRYLSKIGVAYLSLARSARSLSGGELQRINMARCLGSALTDTLFCLDEPSSGLHARDSQNLLEIIRELRDQGNTVVLVEHERHLIEGSDHLIEIGPKAGHLGGELVFAGSPRAAKVRSGLGSHEKIKDLTSAKKESDLESMAGVKFFELQDVRTHNLRGIDVKFPCGRITAVCGVSGSGKTSLVQHTLYPLLAQALGQVVGSSLSVDGDAKGIKPLALVRAHSEVLLVSQGGLGRSSRSNIATYLGLMDDIRKQLAAQPLAKTLKLMPGAFSFNTPGGRCESCRGLGTVVEDLSFLGEMEVVCPVCNGRRFGDDVLQVDIRGKNLNAILKLTVSEAREFFYDRASIVKSCDVIMDMGMGYVTLGQQTSTFSGGEAQRLKLVGLMRETHAEHPSILIFDEPTTGLSDSDVQNLLVQLQALAAKGHTIIVVEHHLDVLRSADWLIEVGPEAAEKGGDLVYQGPPSGISQAERSLTAPFLA